MKLIIAAPAKINIYLRITGTRADGFHEVVTLMHAISLADELTLAPSPSPGIVFQGPPALPADEGNLAYRAAQLWQEVFGRSPGLSITLVKRTPWGAGLGGGSSDAAAVLRGLAQHAALPPTDRRIVALAERLGSDVPFFLHGSCAWCTGRGEAVEPLPPRPGLGVVVVQPSVRISTEDAYGLWRPGLTRETLDITVLRGLWRERSDGIAARLRVNDFEDALFPRYPELAEWVRRLQSAGARTAGLTGSGSALFGLFADRAAAEKVRAELAEKIAAGTFLWAGETIAGAGEIVTSDEE